MCKFFNIYGARFNETLVWLEGQIMAAWPQSLLQNGAPQARGPTLKRQGQRLEAVNKEAHEGAGPELCVHRDLRRPRSESFTSACRPTLAIYIGAENLTNTKIGNASETNQS